MIAVSKTLNHCSVFSPGCSVCLVCYRYSHVKEPTATEEPCPGKIQMVWFVVFLSVLCCYVSLIKQYFIQKYINNTKTLPHRNIQQAELNKKTRFVMLWFVLILFVTSCFWRYSEKASLSTSREDWSRVCVAKELSGFSAVPYLFLPVQRDTSTATKKSAPDASLHAC